MLREGKKARRSKLGSEKSEHLAEWPNGDEIIVTEGEPDQLGVATDAKEATPLTAEPIPRRRSRRFKRWGLIGAGLLAVGVPAGLIWYHYAFFVTSKNAVVRGHLAELGTRLDGVLTQVTVDVGDAFEAGQLLVQLENRHLLAEVEVARAALTSLEQTIGVERVAIEVQQEEVAQIEVQALAERAAAEAEVEVARIRVEDARRSFERQRTLHVDQGIVAGETVQQAEYAMLAADAQLSRARAQAILTEQSVKQSIRRVRGDVRVREAQIGVLQAQKAEASARLARALTDVDGAAIRALGRGAVVRRVLQPGSSVQAGQPVLQVWQYDDLWVEAWVDERDLVGVRIGGRVAVTLPAFPGAEFVGAVSKIGIATDVELPQEVVPQPRFARMHGAPVFAVRIRLVEPPPQLLPGLSAVVAIERQE